MICHRILAAFDGSDKAMKALRQAVQLADRTPGCKLTVAHVKYRPAFALEGFGWVTPDNYQEKLDEYVESLLAKAQEAIKGLPYAEIAILTGYPAAAILDFAADQHCDLIVMGSRGLGAFKEWMLGSVSHNVVQHAKIPVLIVK